MDHRAVQSYLLFGASYGDLCADGLRLLTTRNISEFRRWTMRASTEDLVKRGVRYLREATKSTLERSSAPRHALLLSGGYDSRAVLGALLENLDRSEIVTITFGTPGALDFELPARIAKSVGVANERFDATSITWDTDVVVSDLLTSFEHLSFENLPLPFVDAGHIGLQALRLIDRPADVWSGFLGGPLAGTNLPKVKSPTWEEAISFFAGRNKVSKEVQLATADWEMETLFPRDPIVNPEEVTMDDQLDIAGRQTFRLGVSHPGQHLHLFEDVTLKSYLLSLPWDARANGSLVYRQMLATAFPRLFHLPVQGKGSSRGTKRDVFKRLGRPARRFIMRLQPGSQDRRRLRDTQALDYRQLLRQDTSYARFVKQNIDSLAARPVVAHVDIDRIWSEHQTRAFDHTNVLRMLSSFEVNVLALEARSRTA